MTKPQNPKARRAQILEAATRCFAHKGYHGATMDDIVAETGLSKGSLYWHFENKRELFRSLMDQWFDEILTRTQSILDESASASAKLTAMLEASASTAAAQPELLRALLEFYTMAIRDEELRQWLRGLYIANVDTVASLIAQGIADGEFRDGDPQALARLVLAYLDGVYLHRELFDELPILTEAVTQPLFALLEPEGAAAHGNR